ncbi:MAG TPA: bis(5'-nucleosyl)-tetraphosphatase (symmetrical) YqeK [Candidatus Cybelea sp.]
MSAHDPASFSKLLRRVRKHLHQDDRYAHSVRVARSAGALAQRHGADASKARLAGLLHDLARLYPAARLLGECEKRGLRIDDFERAHPVLLHARLGAALARDQFGIDDPDVLSAIEKHTTAAGEMSPLDCVVYLADSLEPARKFAERPALWQIALLDLAEAMRETLALAIRHHERKGLALAPPTLAAAALFGADSEPAELPEVQASAS